MNSHFQKCTKKPVDAKSIPVGQTIIDFAPEKLHAPMPDVKRRVLDATVEMVALDSRPFSTVGGEGRWY